MDSLRLRAHVVDERKSEKIAKLTDKGTEKLLLTYNTSLN